MVDEKGFMMLKNVRVSFPHLFEAPVINGEEGKCGAVLLLDEKDHAAQIKFLQDHLAKMAKEKFKGLKLPADKFCLRIGEEKRPEYAGYYALSCNNKSAIVVLDARAQLITDPAKCPIYAGCRVNAKVSFWAQDNNFGKRINGNLVAIQFAGDDEALDASYVPVETAAEGFDAATDDSFMD